jgi:hypothetical protein
MPADLSELGQLCSMGRPPSICSGPTAFSFPAEPITGSR